MYIYNSNYNSLSEKRTSIKKGAFCAIFFQLEVMKNLRKRKTSNL